MRYHCGMSVVTFDTLKFAKRLEKAGMESGQSEAFAEAQKEAFAEALDTQLATKSDIHGIHTKISDVQSEITDVRAEMKLMRWMIGFNLAFTMAMLWKIFN